MMKIFLKIAAVSAFIFLGIAVNNADAIHDNAGTTAAQFTKIDVGARAIALGGAYSAVQGDVNSIYWNPSGIAAIDNLQVSFMYNSWLSQAKYSNFLGAYRLKDKGTFGLMINYFTVEEIEGLDEYGFPTGENYKPKDTAIVFSWAKTYSPKVTPGINIKMLSSELTDDISGSAYAVDIGNQMYYMDKRLRIGVVVKNIGTKMELEGKYSLPASLSVGSSYMFKKDITGFMELRMPFDDSLEVALGGEYVRKFKDISGSARAGYETGNEGLSALGGLSLGAGMEWKEYVLDYCWHSYGKLGNSHAVSIGAKWGPFKNKQKEKEEVKKEKTEAQPIITPKAAENMKQIASFISGKIVDEEKNPLKEVTVKIEKKTGKNIDRIFTASNGVYQTETLQPGEFRLTIWKKGYIKQQVIVEVPEDKPAKADFLLQKEIK